MFIEEEDTVVTIVVVVDDETFVAVVEFVFVFVVVVVVGIRGVEAVLAHVQGIMVISLVIFGVKFSQKTNKYYLYNPFVILLI